MKTNNAPSMAQRAHAAPPPRYQLYRQREAGNFHPEFATESAIEAVEVFLGAQPAFEGGALHLWDHHAQRSGASVRWRTVGTDIGFRVSRRVNIFHDAALGSVARELLEREAIRESVKSSLHLSA